MFDEREPWERERQAFLRREERLVCRYSRRKEPFLEKRLEGVVPEGVREKLEAAFFQAFRVILENGSGAIEKTISRKRLEAEYQTREYASRLYPVRKNLAAGRKISGRQRATRAAGASVGGALLGTLGIGLPDIPIFLSVLWRSLYILCLQFGVDYEKREEKEFLLELLVQSLYRGEDFRERDAALNRRIYEWVMKERAAEEKMGDGEGGRRGDESRRDESERDERRRGEGRREERRGEESGEKENRGDGHAAEAVDREKQRRAARALSEELLYLKFLQGIPIVGAAGGIYDGVCLKRVTDYVSIKLERRHLLKAGRL